MINVSSSSSLTSSPKHSRPRSSPRLPRPRLGTFKHGHCDQLPAGTGFFFWLPTRPADSRPTDQVLLQCLLSLLPKLDWGLPVHIEHVTLELVDLISAMQPSSFMCPVLVTPPRAAGGCRVASALTSCSMLVARAEVIILTTNALEQQNGHQVTRPSFDPSVFFVAVDVHCVFFVDDVSTPSASCHFVCQVSPARSSPVCGPVSLAVQVHSRPRVHSSVRLESVLHLSCQRQIVDSEYDWVSPKHEFATHGFGVPHNAILFKRLREQVGAVVTASNFCRTAIRVMLYFLETTANLCSSVSPFPSPCVE